MLRKIHRKAIEARGAGGGEFPRPPEEPTRIIADRGLKGNDPIPPEPKMSQEQKEARVLRRVDPDEPTPPRPRPTIRPNLNDRIEWEDFDPLMMQLR